MVTMRQQSQKEVYIDYVSTLILLLPFLELREQSSRRLADGRAKLQHLARVRVTQVMILKTECVKSGLLT